MTGAIPVRHNQHSCDQSRIHPGRQHNWGKARVIGPACLAFAALEVMALLDGAMTPLVIGLAAVVLVILIAVAVGMRYVRNEERADLADRHGDRSRPEADSGRTRGRPEPSRRAAGPPETDLPAVRPRESGRPRRADVRDGTDRDESRRYSGADRGQDDPRFDGSGRGPRDNGDRRDQPARAQQRQDVRTPARTKSARGRRNDDGDWPSTEWDKLSDADYWKEVASDKPLVTTARVAQPAPEPRSAPPAPSRETASRDSAGRDTAIQPGHQPSGRQEPRRGHNTRRGEEPKREATRPPGRGPLEPAVAGVVHDFLTAPTAARYPQPIRLDPARPDPGRPEQVRPRPAAPAGRPAEQRAAAPMPLDDDPLTSPSFPKIVTSDSRSYHNGRSSASASARPSGPPAQPAADQGAYGAPTAQFAIPGQHSPGHPGPWPADGGSADGYGRGFADGGSAATAPRSYGPAAEPLAGSYPANGYQSPGPAAGTGHGYPAGSLPPARPPLAGPLPPVSPPPASLPPVPTPAGNPYGSYVSADLPGYADSPTAVYPQSQEAYPQSQEARGYPGYSAGPSNGHAGPSNGHAGPSNGHAGPSNGHGGPAYRYDLPLDDSGPLPSYDSGPLPSSAGTWYPEVPAGIPATHSPGRTASLPYAADAYADSGRPGHDYGNRQRGPSGYAPGPYADGGHDGPAYPAGGYETGPDTPVYPPAGGYTGAHPDGPAYLPPEFYGGDGYGGQPRR